MILQYRRRNQSIINSTLVSSQASCACRAQFKRRNLTSAGSTVTGLLQNAETKGSCNFGLGLVA